MKKKRHSWGELEKNFLTQQQVCKKCTLVRYKALGVWFYAKEKVTEENPFPEQLFNEGCNDLKIN